MANDPFHGVTVESPQFFLTCHDDNPAEKNFSAKLLPGLRAPSVATLGNMKLSTARYCSNRLHTIVQLLVQCTGYIAAALRWLRTIV